MTNEPWGNGSCNATEHDRAISGSMVAAWTAMAEQGDPSTKALQWPRFSANNTQGADIGQDNMGVGSIDYSECDFWDGIWASYGGVNISAASVGNSNNGSSNDKGM